MQLVEQDSIQSSGDQREPDPGPAHNVCSPRRFRRGEVVFGNTFSGHMRLSTGFTLRLDRTHRADGRHKDECRREDSYKERQKEANHCQRTRLLSQTVVEASEQRCRCQ